MFYLSALGPLGLTHEDLWRLTRGEIADLAHAYRYKKFLDMQSMAVLAFYIAAAQTGKAKSIDQLCGVWEGGRAMTQEEAAEYYREKARERKNGRNRNQ
jgi:hypothetical protein